MKKKTLFRLSFVGAAMFYGGATLSIWVGPAWGLSGSRYFLVGVLPAFLGVLSTIMALTLHMELQEEDASNQEEDR